ncbi:MAG: homoserine dehydrogenase [Myxococcota bacterium]|nr:homoserine dehydrogenase [Myxococcota bacterium]
MTGRLERRTVRVAMLGCGVVGEGVLRLLRDNASLIAHRLGAELEIRHVVAARPDKPRADVVPLDRLHFDPQRALSDPEVDVVVEVIGGLEPAGQYLREAIARGKHVVTANKALLAETPDLVEAAERARVDLYFEAAVAGGIPIVRVLREALASDRVVALRGIVNGTSNYVLSRMTHDGLDYEQALAEAQRLGYAEADPTLDVSGMDACHKLTLLATLAFGARLTPSQIPTDGIETVGAIDVEMAGRFGLMVKPLAIARLLPDDALDLRVRPALVPVRSPLAGVHGAFNAVLLEGAMLGPCLLSGLGAGALPTATSVVSDLVDVARNLLVGAVGRVPSGAIPATERRLSRVCDPGETVARYYLRFDVKDRTTVLGRIATVLGAFDVAIEQLVQRAGAAGAPSHVCLLTHPVRERQVRDALRETRTLHDVVGAPRLLQVEES